MCRPAGCCHTPASVKLALPAAVGVVLAVGSTVAVYIGDVLTALLVAVYTVAVVGTILIVRLVRRGTGLWRPVRVKAAYVISRQDTSMLKPQAPLAIEAPKPQPAFTSRAGAVVPARKR